MTRKVTFPCYKCTGKGFLSFCAHVDNGRCFAGSVANASVTKSPYKPDPVLGGVWMFRGRLLIVRLSFCASAGISPTD